jgi:hypothetical protein
LQFLLFSPLRSVWLHAQALSKLQPTLLQPQKLVPMLPLLVLTPL